MVPRAFWFAAAVVCGDAAFAAEISVDVKQTFAKPTTAHTLSLREIRKKSGKENTTGLTETRFEATYEARFQLEESGGRWCVKSATADVAIGYTSVTIQIPREYERGSCPYEAVLEHEKKHVAAAREVVKKVGPQVARFVGEAYRNGGPRYCGPSVERARDAAMSAIKTGVSKVRDRAQSVSESLQGAIDTPDEYRRVTASCASWPAR